VSERHEDERNPRWLELASTLQAEPAPGTMARVRARLEEREPVWFQWLARPVTLAVSAGLLVASAWFGASLVDTNPAYSTEGTSFAAALLEDDGNFGLALESSDELPAEAGADSEEVSL
jgi:hypothetical protein